MIDILLISDQPRLHGILGTLGELPDIRLRVANGLSQGLEEIATKSPHILFLQNRLSGLSGFILVRHVREATNPASTRIILLTEGMQGSDNSTADIELLTGVSDTELSDAISEIIGDQAGPVSSVPLALEEKKPAVFETPPPPLHHEVTDNVSLSHPPRLSMPDNPSPLPATLSKARLSNPDGDSGTQATVLNSSPPPIQWEKKRLIVAVSVLAVLCVIALLAAFFFRADKGQPSSKTTATPTVPDPGIKQVHLAVSSASNALVKPVQPAVSSSIRQAVPPVVRPDNSLPAFIRSAGPDPRYSLTNPGWERYTSSARDYKIYRESGAIKAIQVLDRQSTGISPAFFSSAIREFARVRDYRTVSREIKGDFLVKKGKLSKSSEVILYKDRSDKILRAFVIHTGTRETIPENKGSK